jgi:hypothetical protein
MSLVFGGEETQVCCHSAKLPIIIFERLANCPCGCRALFGRMTSTDFCELRLSIQVLRKTVHWQEAAHSITVGTFVSQLTIPQKLSVPITPRRYSIAQLVQPKPD